jgi:hypothetical protein
VTSRGNVPAFARAVGVITGPNELALEAMVSRGQVFALKESGTGEMRCAYRYRAGGRGARRVQRGLFWSQQAAAQALERYAKDKAWPPPRC